MSEKPHIPFLSTHTFQCVILGLNEKKAIVNNINGMFIDSHVSRQNNNQLHFYFSVTFTYTNTTDFFALLFKQVHGLSHRRLPKTALGRQRRLPGWGSSSHSAAGIVVGWHS